MDSTNSSNKTYGVIGAGSFGTAIANLLAENGSVLLYSRNLDLIKVINETRENRGQKLHGNITLTNDLAELASNCYLIFPIVPSENFGAMLDNLAPHLKPYHTLIHGTKGLHVNKKLKAGLQLKKDEVHTMSELIAMKTGVVKIGCLAGPNLASELADMQPAATVIASHFDEVIAEGQLALRSSRFRIYGSKELTGVELAGVLKNYIAILSGMLSGMGFGENSRALLITRGMAELIFIAKSLGASEKAFLGLAGVGDLIATCNSPKSRNYRVGLGLSQGKNLDTIIKEIGEVAEGVKTLQIVKALEQYGFKAPMAKILHKIIFEDFPLEKGLEFLMKFPVDKDAEYI
ncbi:MAG: NAD(P)H-dependent glycerol-3-phosphate dehydrogenase [Chitinophagales bacterium]